MTAAAPRKSRGRVTPEQVEQLVPPQVYPTPGEPLIINDLEVIMDWRQAIADLDAEPEIALDLETGGLHHWEHPVAVVQMYAGGERIYVLHLADEGFKVPPELAAFLSRPDKTFVGHNIFAFDLLFLANNGVDIDGPTYYDSMVAEIILNVQNRRNVSVSLQNTVDRRLGKGLKKEAGEHRWMEKRLTIQQITYCLEDVQEILPLKRAQADKIIATGQQDAVDLEMYIGPVYARMGVNGLPVDKTRLDAYLVKQRKQANEAGAAMRAALGEMNFNSPKQVKEAFERVGVSLMNTRAETLEELAELPGPGQEIAKLMVDFRHGEKRCSVYEPLLDRFGGRRWLVNPKSDNRTLWWHIYGRTRQIGADTGRSTSSDPNLQQIPQDMRDVFGGAPGWVMLSRDYSAIEVVVAATIAQDQVLLELLKGSDSHRMVASLVFGIPPEQVTKVQRNLAKAMSFTLIFGGGARTLWLYASRYGATITLEEAKELIHKFFSQFQGLKRNRNLAYRKADEYNQAVREKRPAKPITITLPSGLKRQLMGDKASPTVILNTSVQGTAAAGLKAAVRLLRQWNMHKYICAVVHDEILIYVPDHLAHEYDAALDRAMLEGMWSMIGEDAPVKTGVTCLRYTKEDKEAGLIPDGCAVEDPILLDGRVQYLTHWGK